MEGKDDILKAMEQARQDSDALRRESDALKRDLSTMQASRAGGCGASPQGRVGGRALALGQANDVAPAW